jgi:uncharacterized protein
VNGQKAIILAAPADRGQRKLCSTVKLHLTRGEGRNQITSAGSGYVSVNGRRYETSVVVTSDSVSDWPVAGASALDATDIGSLLEYKPEIALIGTGARLRFPPATVLRPLIDAGIGYEIMDTAAACRTYGILMAEGRRVVAALIVS